MKLASILAVLVPAAVRADPAQVGAIERVSVDAAGAEGNDHASAPDTSADGRFVVFESRATNLVPGDANFATDVFLHDRLTGNVTLISLSLTGGSANNISFAPHISGDGRWIAFDSLASDLVIGDSNGFMDVFVFDTVAQTMRRVSVSGSGAQANQRSNTNALSADGTTVAFASLATNLVPGDLNAAADIFVHDLLTGQTENVHVSSSGQQGNQSAGDISLSLSRTGRHVTYASPASNLVPGDTNNRFDVFLHDRSTGQTTRESLTASGGEGSRESLSGSVNVDAARVVFSSLSALAPGATNANFDVFVREPLTGAVSLVSRTPAGVSGNGQSEFPRGTTDGRFVAFSSAASDLVSGDTNGVADIFVRDLATGATLRASLLGGGLEPNDFSSRPAPAEGGSAVAFASQASNLVAGDGNGKQDVFVADLAPPVAIHCAAKPNSLGCLPRIRAFGTPRAQLQQGFTVHATQVRNNKPGLLFYGLTGRAALPLQCGTLCVAGPIRRTPAVDAGGAPAPTNDCSGNCSIDMATFAAGGLGGSPQPGLSVAGTTVNCQWWGRDQGFAPPCNTTLSDALEYTVVP